MTEKPRVEVYTSRHCPYCRAAKMLLARKSVSFAEIDIAANAERLEEMVSRSGGSSTLPQIFVDGMHIGDNSALRELDRRGELDRLLGLAESV